MPSLSQLLANDPSIISDTQSADKWRDLDEDDPKRDFMLLWSCFQRFLREQRSDANHDKEMALLQPKINKNANPTKQKPTGQTKVDSPTDIGQIPPPPQPFTATPATDKGAGKQGKKSKLPCLDFQVHFGGPGCNRGDKCRYRHDVVNDRKAFDELVSRRDASRSAS